MDFLFIYNLSNEKSYKLYAFLISKLLMYIMLKKFFDQEPDISLFYFNHNKSSTIVNLFNLNQEIKPFYIYNQIKCRKSIEIFHFALTLCVYPKEEDIYMSSHIWRDGIWKEKLIRKFLNYVYFNPNHLVIDLGDNSGQYGLFAAKMSRNIIMIEPFHENILRIHKAARIENIHKRIVLIKNVMSNKRGEIRNLTNVKKNPENEKIVNNDYLVKTIIFDDILNNLPLNPISNKKYKSAIMKIDLKYFELHAFQSANVLFKKLKIDYIFMEWDFKKNGTEKNYFNLIQNMIDFLHDYNMFPYDLDGKVLKKFDHSRWPLDVVWVKSN